MSRNIINDGYTRHGYLAAVERMHGDLRFTYRPMLPEETASLVGDSFIQRNPVPQKRFAIMAAAIQGKLVEWSETDEKGEAIKITIDAVRRMPWNLFHGLFNVISGVGSSDADPLESPTEETDAYTQRLLEAAQAGVNPGVAIARADLKN